MMLCGKEALPKSREREKDERMRQAAVHDGGTMARWLCRAKD